MKCFSVVLIVQIWFFCHYLFISEISGVLYFLSLTVKCFSFHQGFGFGNFQQENSKIYLNKSSNNKVRNRYHHRIIPKTGQKSQMMKNNFEMPEGKGKGL